MDSQYIKFVVPKKNMVKPSVGVGLPNFKAESQTSLQKLAKNYIIEDLATHSKNIECQTSLQKLAKDYIVEDLVTHFKTLTCKWGGGKFIPCPCMVQNPLSFWVLALNLQLLELPCRHSAGKKNYSLIAHPRGKGKDLIRYVIFVFWNQLFLKLGLQHQKPAKGQN